MTKRKKGCLIFLVIFLVACVIIAWCQTPNGEVDISKEATYYTEPLLADGRVDYTTAMNLKYGEGVTNENNALVPLLKTINVAENSSPEFLDALLRELGLGPTPLELEHFGFEPMLEKLFPIDVEDEAGFLLREKQWLAIAEPWTSESDPQLAEVLKQLSPSIDLIVEASKRPRYFVPIVFESSSDEDRLLSATTLPVSQLMRGAAHNLGFRAMNRLGEGDIDGAIEDIKSMRRLARLINQSPILIDGLICIAIEGIAIETESKLIQSADISPQQLRDYQQFLNEPQPYRISLLERIGNSDRFIVLDLLFHSSIYAKSSSIMSSLSYDAGVGSGFELLSRTADTSIAMREVNRHFDEMIALLDSDDPRQRIANSNLWETELMDRERQFTGWGRMVSRAIGGPTSRGIMLGEMCVLLFAPALPQLFVAETKGEMANELLDLAISIELFKRAVGHYPDSLEELQPDTIDEIPQDWFSTGTVTYRRTDTGFVVYSMGINKVDDGGFNYDDSDGGKDDVRIRVGDIEE